MIVDFNHIYDKYDLQLDGGQISIPAAAANGLLLRKNWVHDSNPPRDHGVKWGLRFDRGQSTCNPAWPRRGTMENNVIFNTNGLNVKGNEHKITQNTVFWSAALGGALDDANAVAKFVDVNLYASKGGIGTCECTDASCTRDPECCNGDRSSEENALTEVVGNLMDNCRGATGGVPFKVSTAEV